MRHKPQKYIFFFIKFILIFNDINIKLLENVSYIYIFSIYFYQKI